MFTKSQEPVPASFAKNSAQYLWKNLANEKNFWEKIISRSSNFLFLFYIFQVDHIVTDDALFLLEEAKINSMELAYKGKILARKM